ncbi:MAG: BamA/TamA family outer membrane protein [Ignavibacteriales bacterium]|nr:BamA/TamA family outer membrane protein [Ignavibacteriales bacterium]
MTKLQIILFLFLTTTFCFALELDSMMVENEKSIRVDSIRLVGNEITKDEIILRELNFKIGDMISRKDLRYNEERIYSLGLFNHVRTAQLDEDNLSKIIITVEESWYIWPLPLIDFRDNDFNKFTYGMNLLYKNFRGMNETISCVLAFGYDPFYILSYYNPWFIKKQNISLSFGISYNKILNKSPLAFTSYGGQFEYKYLSAYINIGKRFNLFNEAYLFFGYDYVEIPKKVDGLITGSEDRIDRIPKIGLTYIFDSRNLKQFPDSGIYTNVNYTQKGFGVNKIYYSSFSLNFITYNKVVGNLTSKLRFSSRFTFGKTIPFYDNSFLGVGDKIRGHYQEISEGHNRYLVSAELKYPIIRDFYFSIKLPWIPQELTSYRLAVYGNLFGDNGATQFHQDGIRIKELSGYGAGLIFLFLPYNIFRATYALNEYKKGEWIFELGFSF